MCSFVHSYVLACALLLGKKLQITGRRYYRSVKLDEHDPTLLKCETHTHASSYLRTDCERLKYAMVRGLSLAYVRSSEDFIV